MGAYVLTHVYITLCKINLKSQRFMRRNKQSIQNRNKLLSIRKQTEANDTTISTTTTEMIWQGRGWESFGEEFFSL
jgi:hypothetical protein